MKYTLALSALLVLSYFFLSSGFFYIPDQNIMAASFSAGNPLGIFTYSFTHIGLTHLLGNLFLLIPLGIVAEGGLRSRRLRKSRTHLRPKDFLAIYFSSAFLAAILFVIVVPNVVLVGASAAIAGLVIPACLIDFKKTIIYVAVFTAIAILLTSVSGYLVAQAQTSTQDHIVALQNELNKTQAEKNRTVFIIQSMEEKYQKNEISQDEYLQATQQLTQQLENLSNIEESIIIEANKTTELADSIKYGQDREQIAKTSMAIHVIGSFWGLGYLWLFRRDIIFNSGEQFIRFQKWIAKQKKRL